MFSVQEYTESEYAEASAIWTATYCKVLHIMRTSGYFRVTAAILDGKNVQWSMGENGIFD